MMFLPYIKGVTVELLNQITVEYTICVYSCIVKYAAKITFKVISEVE